jgi:hypothetical protein
LFTTTQVPFSLIEEEAFRDLLIYCEPRLHNSHIGANTTKIG